MLVLLVLVLVLVVMRSRLASSCFVLLLLPSHNCLVGIGHHAGSREGRNRDPVILPVIAGAVISAVIVIVTQGMARHYSNKNFLFSKNNFKKYFVFLYLLSMY